MAHAYDDGHDEVLVDSARRIHANGEETHIHILSCGDRYLVVAADVDPRDFQAVGAEAVGYEPTKESAEERATAWMEAHPRGVAAQSGGGSRIMAALKKLNDYGDSLQQTNSEDN